MYVQFPCIEVLESNPENYRQIFSADTINIVVECGHPNSWYKHTNKVLGISSFGESAPQCFVRALWIHACTNCRKVKKTTENKIENLVDLDLVGKRVGHKS